MGIVTVMIYIRMNRILGLGIISESIALGISILIGAFVYGIMVILLKAEEVNIVRNVIKIKVNTKLKKSSS